jgi:hypothetical protein
MEKCLQCRSPPPKKILPAWTSLYDTHRRFQTLGYFWGLKRKYFLQFSLKCENSGTLIYFGDISGKVFKHFYFREHFRENRIIIFLIRILRVAGLLILTYTVAFPPQHPPALPLPSAENTPWHMLIKCEHISLFHKKFGCRKFAYLFSALCLDHHIHGNNYRFLHCTLR